MHATMHTPLHTFHAVSNPCILNQFLHFPIHCDLKKRTPITASAPLAVSALRDVRARRRRSMPLAIAAERQDTGRGEAQPPVDLRARRSLLLLVTDQVRGCASISTTSATQVQCEVPVVPWSIARMCGMFVACHDSKFRAVFARPDREDARQVEAPGHRAGHT